MASRRLEGSVYAIRQTAFGGAEELRHAEVPDPEPGDGQVRVDVRAAGVHFIDTAIRAGQSGPMPRPELPMTPGREVAGVVDALGPGVEPDWLGQDVVVHLGTANGGYAEKAVADVASLHRLESGTDPAEAVAMIGTGRTTVAILRLADLSADDVVLVTAAAGGIGTLLLQAARAAGATVVGLAGSADKVARVRSHDVLGVDYLRSGWPDEVVEVLNGRAATVAFDGVGGQVGRGVLELLGPGGRLVLFGFSSGEPTPLDATDLFARSLTATSAIGPAIYARNGGIRNLERAALDALESDELVPAVQRFALSDAAGAHRAIESRQTMGKVMLVPA